MSFVTQNIYFVTVVWMYYKIKIVSGSPLLLSILDHFFGCFIVSHWKKYQSLTVDSWYIFRHYFYSWDLKVSTIDTCIITTKKLSTTTFYLKFLSGHFLWCNFLSMMVVIWHSGLTLLSSSNGADLFKHKMDNTSKPAGGSFPRDWVYFLFSLLTWPLNFNINWTTLLMFLSWVMLKGNIFMVFYLCSKSSKQAWVHNSVEDVLQVLILFCLESLESDRVLLYSERHCLLRVLPVLVVLATSGEKEGESFFKRIKLPRLIHIFRVWHSILHK